MNSSTKTLIEALRILARDIESDDWVANAAIGEAADRLEQQQDYIKRLEEFGDNVQHNAIIDEDVLTTDEWDKAKEAKP